VAQAADGRGDGRFDGHAGAARGGGADAGARHTQPQQRIAIALQAGTFGQAQAAVFHLQTDGFASGHGAAGAQGQAGVGRQGGGLRGAHAAVHIQAAVVHAERDAVAGQRGAGAQQLVALAVAQAQAAAEIALCRGGTRAVADAHVECVGQRGQVQRLQGVYGQARATAWCGGWCGGRGGLGHIAET
jgi:hypothetical protein